MDKIRNKGGRPKTTVKQRVEMITFDYAKIKKLAEFGFIDTQLAELLGVNESTITRWKQASPELMHALKEGKGIADARVVRSLYERATGYEHQEMHISNYQGVITQTEITKHYPPDSTAMIFWLKNRQPDKWRDKQEIDFTKPLEVIITDYRGKQD